MDRQQVFQTFKAEGPKVFLLLNELRAGHAALAT